MQSKSSFPISEWREREKKRMRRRVYSSVLAVPLTIDDDTGISSPSLSVSLSLFLLYLFDEWVKMSYMSIIWLAHLLRARERETRRSIHLRRIRLSFSEIRAISMPPDSLFPSNERSMFLPHWNIMIVITGDVNGSFIIENEDLCLDDLSSSINTNTTENARREVPNDGCFPDSDIKRATDEPSSGQGNAWPWSFYFYFIRH